ncbi:MAG TPA: hypothetical protein VFO83_11065, partial [Aggregicoccus sp.]|nr:hypothetical protein [Aggregicoccus sp.]
DGETMELRVLGLWRGTGAREDELVLDLAVDNGVKGKGLELAESQFAVTTERGPQPVDPQRTAELVLRPQSPFLVPPGGSARFQLAFATSSPPAALQVHGFHGELQLPLASLKESETAPVHADPSRRAEDLIERLPLPASEEEDGAAPLALASPVPASPAAAEPPLPFPDDREPNGGTDHPGVLGEDGEAQGSFAAGSGSDVDVYRFTVTGAPALYALEAEGAELLELRYQVMSRNNTPRARAQQGRAALHDLFLRPGTHFVSVVGRSKDAAAPGAYAVRLVPQGGRAEDFEAEPNDDVQRAELLALGETRRGRLTHADDRDVYLFSLHRTEPVSIQLRGPRESLLRVDLQGPGASPPLSSVTRGAPIAYRTLLQPGDYALWVRAEGVSLSPYELGVHRLDPFLGTGDLEPNDSSETAGELPADGVVTGSASRYGDRDFYRLPASAEGSVLLEPSGEGVHLSLRAEQGGWIDLKPLGEGDPRLRGTLPRGARALLTVESSGPYSVQVHPAQRAPAHPRPLSLTLGAHPAPLAAWWHEAQQLELPLTLESPDAQRVSLRAWTSHPGWRAELVPAATLGAGKPQSLKLRLAVAPDAASELPVRVAVEAVGASGARAVASTELSAACGAAPVAAHPFRPLPEALLGGLDVASLGLGGKVVPSGQFATREPLLLRGLVTLDHDFYANTDKLPFDFTVDLAGEEPVEVAGFLLHPPGGMTRNVTDVLRDFEVLLSQDGVSFTPALRATLDEVSVEQSFVLPRPLPARFARLRFLSTWKGRAPYAGLATFKVVASPASLPDAARGGLDLAAPAAGGHVVWADLGLGRARELHTPERERPDYWADPATPASFVVGFQHERAARVRALEWVEPPEPLAPSCSLSKVHVALSTTSPFGPWTPAGTWALERDAGGVARLALGEPTWARYVRFSLPPPSEKRERCRLPDSLRILEQPAGGGALSALGEWGHAAREAAFERQAAKPTA